jgi:hypothetical protein
MSEERDPFPTEDPREKDASDQNAEENPGEVTPRDAAQNDEDDANADA